MAGHEVQIHIISIAQYYVSVCVLKAVITTNAHNMHNAERYALYYGVHNRVKL